jgi:Mg2+ and Co2+ transporter CorA
MFGIPGEVFWPTASFAAILALVFTGVAVLRYLPKRRTEQPDQESLEDLRNRVDQLEQMQERVSQLEERLDFAERMLTKQREAPAERLPPPHP